VKSPLGSGLGQEGEHHASAEINVTPLVDVMLVLLIVFMVTAPLLAAGVPVRLPEARGLAPETPRAPIVVSVTADGRTFLGPQELASEALVREVIERRAGDQTRIVYVRADRDAAYGRVVELMGALAAGGVSRLSLIAQTAQGPPRP
jgi:biopolymer transport protein TolR